MSCRHSSWNAKTRRRSSRCPTLRSKSLAFSSKAPNSVKFLGKNSIEFANISPHWVQKKREHLKKAWVFFLTDFKTLTLLVEMPSWEGTFLVPSPDSQFGSIFSLSQSTLDYVSPSMHCATKHVLKQQWGEKKQRANILQPKLGSWFFRRNLSRTVPFLANWSDKEMFAEWQTCSR